MKKYTEVKYQKTITRISDTQTQISFERISEGRQVQLTDQEAEMMNAGKVQNTDLVISLFLLPGERDPETYTRQNQIAGIGTAIDVTGNVTLPNMGSGSLPGNSSNAGPTSMTRNKKQ